MWRTLILREHARVGNAQCTIPIEHVVGVYSPGSGYYDTPTHSKDDHMTQYYVRENTELPHDYGQASRVVEKNPDQTPDQALL